MSKVRAKRRHQLRVFSRAIARLRFFRLAWAPKAVTMDMLETRQMLSSTLSISGAALVEPSSGIAAATFPVTLSEISTSDVTVHYKTIAGSARPGKDYVATSGKLTIPAGTLSSNINISVIGGVAGNTTKDFSVKLKKPKGATIATGVASCAITDDITPSLSVQSTTTTEGNGNHSLKLAVLLSGKETQPVTVDWATANGTATAGVDYTASQGSLTFKPKQTLKTITIPIIGKTVPTTNETFNVNLSNPQHATIATNGVETIVGNNGSNQIYIDDEKITRPASGYKDLNFKVHLRSPSDGTASVDYSTLPGPNSVGQYVSVDGTVQFLKGQTTTNISVPIVGTTFYNPVMTFYVQLSDPADAQIADNQATGTILSNSSPPQIPPPVASVNSISAAEGNSGNTPFTFTVSLSSASAQPVVVYYQTADGTAKDGTDYVGGGGAVYFSPGVTSQSVTVNVIGNTTLEPNKTFDLDLTGATNAYLSDTASEGLGTIINDDFPTLSVADTQVSATSVGTTTTATFTVSLNEPTDETVTADYATSDGSATVAASDYDPAMGTLTFAPGVTTQTVNVTVNGKGDADLGDSFFLNLSDVSDTALLGTAQASATVIQAPSISVGNVSVDESNGGGKSATFTVSLSNLSTQTVTVNYATADGSAHAGTNYTAESGTLTFAPGAALSQTITVPVATNIEDGETFALNLSGATNATISSAQATALLTNPPAVSVSDPSISTTQTATTTTNFAVSLSAPSLRTITVQYHTADGTATQPTDYQAASGTVTFAPGTTSVTVPVTVHTSPAIADGAQFYLDLTDPTIASLATSSAAATFVNEPALSVGNIVVPIDGTDSATAVFAIELSTASEHQVSVQYTTENGTATAPGSYTSESGTVIFPAGTTSETVDVPVNGASEDGASFYLDLSSPTNATIASSSAMATVSNPPTISIAGNSQDEGDSGTTDMPFTLTLSAPSFNPITVDYYTSDGSASGGVDYTSESGSVDFPANATQETIEIPILGNTEYEPDKTFTVTLHDPVNAGLSTSTATGTILNDDPIPTISISSASANEGDSGTTPMNFTVSLSNPSYQNICVDYATSDGTATGGDDYESASGVLNIPAGQSSGTITVNVYGDATPETDEYFNLTLSNPMHASLSSPTEVTGTILNDDGGGISINSVVVPENDPHYNPTEAIFTISLATPYADTVHVDYNTVDGTALGGQAFTSTSGGFDFAPGQTQQLITIPVNDQYLFSGSQQFSVQLTSVSEGVPVTQGSGTATIIDNYSEPSVSVSGGSVEESADPSAHEMISFTVTVNGRIGTPVTLDYSTADDSASGGVDYTTTFGSLTFPVTSNNCSTQTVCVPVTPGLDPINSTDFEFQITNIQNASNDNNTAYGYINNDNVAPYISVYDNSVNENAENGATATLPLYVYLNHSYSEDVTVDYTTQDGSAFGTASGGSDYQSQSGTLTIPAGNYYGEIDVPVNYVSGNSGGYDFSLVLSNPSNASFSNNTATGTIYYNEDQPQAYVTPSDYSVSEGDTGDYNQYHFQIGLTNVYDYPVEVDYYTSDGSASGGVDYQSTSGLVDFEPGDTGPQDVSVTIIGNDTEQANRDFLFNISSPDVSVGSPADGIIQDDDEPILSVSGSSLVEPASGQTQNLAFTLSLQKPLSYAVSVDYSSSGGGEEVGSVSGSFTFQPGVTSTEVDLPVSGGFDLDGNDYPNLNVTVHDPLNGDQNPFGTGTVYASDETNLSLDTPVLCPINSETSKLTFTVYNNGSDYSGNDQLEYFAIPYGSTDGTQYQIEAINTDSDTLANSFSGLAPGDSQDFTVQPIMVDQNGNAIPAGYYNIEVEIVSSGGAELSSATSSNELPYTHTQVLWTGNAGDDQWDNPNNWNILAVPSAGDDVVINDPDQTDAISYEDLDSEINSLFSNSPIDLNSGSLTIDTTVQVNNDFDLAGGELINATLIPGTSGQGLIITPQGGDLKDVIANAQIDATQNGAYVTVIDQLTLNQTFYLGDPNSNNSATLYFATDGQGCAYLTGTGGIGFGESGTSQIINTSGGGDHMLVIEAGIDGPGGTITNPYGSITSDGNIEVGDLTINGNFTNNGELYPGGDNDPGTLTINGNFTQSSEGTLNIDIGGSGGSDSFDQISVSGTANLDGTLNFALTYGYHPQGPITFDVITYTSQEGAFATINGSAPYYDFTETYGATTFTISATYLGTTYYVDANSTADSPDGSSWTSAFTDLQTALAAAYPGDTIDVAGGTYYPGNFASDSFDIPSGVEIYGGYAGSADSGAPDTRDIGIYPSYLSGDLGPDLNVFHVVNADNTDASTRLDGFTIEYGYAADGGGGLYAAGASLTIANCTFFKDSTDGEGGAIYLDDSSPIITNCTFMADESNGAGGAIAITDNSFVTISNSTFNSNYAYQVGGAIIITANSTENLTDCIFEGNTAVAGGAIFSEDSGSYLTNCVFVSNTAYGYPGDGDGQGGAGGAIFAADSGVYLYNSTLTNNYAYSQNGDGGASYGGAISAEDSLVVVSNSILWGDQASFATEIYNDGNSSSVIIANSDIDDSALASDGSDSFDTDPMFLSNPGPVDSGNFGDLHLTLGSPAIDAGDDTAVFTNTDLSGNPRIVGPAVDLGAYEAQFVYVDSGATGTDDGTSWANAFTNANAISLNGGDPGDGAIIEFAGGTYVPTSNGDERSASFNILPGVQVYGGFAGSALPNAPGTRDVSTYVSTLSGNIGSGGVDTDNSYHVVYADGVSPGTRLDGFTITAGHESSYGSNSGGGMFIIGGSLTVNDCIFTDNFADAGGGAVYATADASPTFTNCTFTDNTASNGGAVYSDQGSAPSFSHCAFTTNTATGVQAAGGAIDSTGASLNLLDCNFDGNSADASGGAIASSDANLSVVNCVFVGNTASGNTYDGAEESAGGAIYFDGDDSGTGSIINSTFTDNSAKGVTYAGVFDGGYGGAIDVVSGTLTISNSIVFNDSAAYGSEIYISDEANVTVSYTDIKDSDLATGTGDIDIDPTFVRAPSAGPDAAWGTSDDDYGDLRLVIGSPAIDAGNNNDVPDGVTTDILGNPRIIDSANTSDTADAVVDMGAYETNPIYVDSNEDAGIQFSQPGFVFAPPAPGSSWADAYSDISDALANAHSGQMIFLAGGVYFPGSVSTDTLNLVDGVAIFGGFDGNETGTPDHRDTVNNPSVINGDLYSGGGDGFAAHIFTGTDLGALTVLDGLTIESAQSGDFGGAVRLTNSSPVINNGDFEYDSATDDGGAIYDTAGSPMVLNSTFNGDTVDDAGGAIYFGPGSALLSNDVFTNDSADDDGSGTGGAIYFEQSAANLIDCEFTGNSTVFYGGAIYADDATLNLIDPTFTNNSATDGSSLGGAIYANTGELTISDGNFTSNSAFEGGAIYSSATNGSIANVAFFTNTGTNPNNGGGGAIFESGGEIDIFSSAFNQNSGYYGGAINLTYASPIIFGSSFYGNTAGFSAGGISANYDSPDISNSIFYDNSAGTYGGAIGTYGAGNVSIINCTITDSSASSGDGGAISVGGGVTIDNSIVYGDNGAEIVGDPATVEYSDIQGGYAGTGNVDVDPQFVVNPSVSGDLHLSPTSPLIDAGDNDFVTVPSDYTGNTRIENGTVDIGAYEVQDFYVDPNDTGTGDGSSWTNAETSLANALSNAPEGSIIYVAGGTYSPGSDGNPQDAFLLPSFVSIYGGYAGSADTDDPFLNDPTTYPSILSGDVGDGNHAYHVVVASGTYGTLLDGFTITGGGAVSEGPDAGGGGLIAVSSQLTIANCTFTYNDGYYGGAILDADSNLTITGSAFEQNESFEGGAIASGNGGVLTITNSSFSENVAIFSDAEGGAIYTDESTLTATDCTFDDNTAFYGGAVESDSSTLTIVNCLFTNNTATGDSGGGDFGGYGGAIDLYDGSTANITNTTFSGNSAQDNDDHGDESGYSYGGAISVSDSTVTLTNSILWNDSADYGNEIYARDDSTVSITYSDVNDSDLATDTGDIDADPLFVDTDNFQLSYSSPAIDAGNNSDIPDGITTDLAGNPRIDVDGIVDMGAYETSHIHVFVDAGATGNDDGTDWADAYNSLTTALTNATPDAGETIYIAGGTYTPGSSESNTFSLPQGVALSGGYAGSADAGSPGTRDVSLYPTVLSGELGSAGYADNSYTILYLHNGNAQNVIDGVTITGGQVGAINLSGSATFNDVIVTANQGFASLYMALGSDVTITNSTFSDNSASSGAAILDHGTLQLSDTAFSDNTESYWGAVYSDYSGPLTITDSTFTGNVAENAEGYGGGAIYAGAHSGLVSITGSTFINNTAIGNGGGGAIYLSAPSNILDSTFDGNTANDGGAIFYDYTDSAPTLTNCVFDDNLANLQGGALNIYDANVQISDCTFTANSAASNSGAYGGAIFDQTEAGYSGHPVDAVIITNSILWNDGSTEIYVQNIDGGPTPDISYSDVDGGYTGTGNIDADPQFATAPTAGPDGDFHTADDTYGDLRLVIGSPAVDAGNNNDVPGYNADLPGGGTTDVAGNPRVIDSLDTSDNADAIVDMGAYETDPVYVDANLGSSVRIAPDVAEQPATPPPAVGNSWDNAYADLENALANAQPGQMLFVAGADYYLDGADATETFNIPAGVSLFGGFEGDTSGTPDVRDATSTLHGLNSGGADPVNHTVTITDGTPDTVLDGFSIADGLASGSGIDTDGGDLLIIGGNPTINNCDFTSGSAVNDGGAIAMESASPYISNCVFATNAPNDGGAIYSLSSSPTIISSTFDGLSSGNVGGAIYFSGGSPTLAGDGFHGNVQSLGAGSAGGAIVFNNCDTVLILDCSLSGNVADFGGAIYADGGDITIDNTSFASNGTDTNGEDEGGAIFITGGSLTIENGSTFSGGYGSLGGDIFAESSSLTITGSTLQTGSAVDGGAIYATASSLTLTNDTLQGSSANDNGGAIYTTNGSTLNVTYSQLTGEHASNSSGDGGAIYTSDTTVTIDGTTFDGDTAYVGGAAYFGGSSGVTLDADQFVSNSAGLFGGAMSADRSTLVVTNSLFVLNSAGNRGEVLTGYAAYITLINDTMTDNKGSAENSIEVTDGSLEIDNSILYGDLGSEILAPTITPTVNNSDIQGGYAGTGNVDVDPEFVRNAGTNSSTDVGDETLQPGSPLVDAGDSSFVTTSTDLAGNARIQGAAVDIGAYEVPIIMVDQNATGNNDGTSWADAYTSLSTALSNANTGDLVEVAGGTFVPSTDGNANDTFDIHGGIAVFGGYAGSANASDPGARNINLYPTILSGDIGDGSPNNSYHILSAFGTNPDTRLDGLTIEDSYAGSGRGGGIFVQSGDLTVSNCTFTDNTANQSLGGAIYAYDGGTLTVLDCTFSGNTAQFGGAICTLNSVVSVIENSTFTSNSALATGGAIDMNNVGAGQLIQNCIFDGNTAADGGAIKIYGLTGSIINCAFSGNSAYGYINDVGGDGGALAATSVGLTITNSTFAGNQAVTQGPGLAGNGGALYISASPVTITNSILWNDAADNGPEISADGSSNLSIYNTDIAGSTPAAGTDNIDADPQFIRNPGTNGSFDYGDLHLASTSPSVDTGNNAYILNGVTTDLDGNPRIYGANVDMGAYEYQPVMVYVDAAATGAETGADWADAYTSLQYALANPVNGELIEIAGGTYTPGTNRTDTFNISTGLTFQGGYAGAANPANPGLRDVSTYVTDLSGDIGTVGDTTDNSYDVITLDGVGSTTVLDGITVSHGNADGGSFSLYDGGGILLIYGTLTLNNCTVTDNLASDGAGIYCDSVDPLSFTNCTFSNNVAQTSAGAIEDLASDLTLTDCTFTDNSLTDSNGEGGAIYSYAPLTVIASTFDGNTAYLGGGICFDASGVAGVLTLTGDIFTSNAVTSGGGGALYIQFSTGNITGCTFTSNSAAGQGGAIMDYAANLNITGSSFTTNSVGPLIGSAGGAIENYGDNDSDPINITSCIFDGNTATSYGGAIANYAGANPTLVNCLFSLNTAGVADSIAGEGGAIYTSSSSPTFINCTFAGNAGLDPVAAGSYGGAMYVTGTGATTISNCILYGDSADNFSEIDNNGSTVNIDHSDIAGGDSINGNSGADPLFVQNPGSADSGDYGDLHLQDGSPALGAGDPSKVPGDITTDLDGNPRIVDNLVDMGAYETQS